jgi:lipoprotein-releasing system permease protein
MSRPNFIRERLKALSFPMGIARRYLFSKKSHNAINIISGISAAGVCIGTLSLVCVLSVFNGFEGLIEQMFSAFDPDLRITLVKGKTFDATTEAFSKIRKHPSVVCFTEVIEENALLRYKEKQMPGTIKGVSKEFEKMTQIGSIIVEGNYQLYDGAFYRAVPGMGVANTLGLSPHFIDPLVIYAPKRNGNINLLNPQSSFTQMNTFVAGVFAVKQAVYDERMVIVSIKMARELFEYNNNTVTAIELKINQDADVKLVKQDLEKILGNQFAVKNRYEQQESFFKIMKIEKWITFLILSFILLIACFNIIGSLSMLIIDKRADIVTLRNLGATNQLIKKIFLFEGWMISVVGALAGIVLGTIICLAQEYFGIIRLGEGYVVDAYPVMTKFTDTVLVFFTVIAMGFLAAYYPVRFIESKNIKSANE